MAGMKHNVPLDGEWLTVTDQQLDLMKSSGDFFRHRLEEARTNPLAHFMPHGVLRHEKELVYADGRVIFPKSQYPKKVKNDGVAFLSIRDKDCLLLVGPNQMGKSYLLAAWTGLHTIPLDPDSPIFTECGVEWHEWEGPKTWIVASYSWDNVGTIWERIRAIFPQEELGDYAPGKKSLTFGDGRPKKLRLKCGSIIIFLCYTQKQEHWEGFTSDGASFDEQCPVDKFIGWQRSTTTGGDYTPCAMALTGHVLKERPDTGAGGWIYLDLWLGRNDRGLNIGRFNLSVESTPDAVVSAKKKQELWDRWVNPDKERSEAEERAAIARYWGGWEQGSGLVFDEFNRDIHIIPRLWPDDKVPADWTKYRIIDYGHGQTGVTACAWMAVSPAGFSVCYRLFYEKNMIAADSCREIIEMSHNTRTEVEPFMDYDTGNLYKRFVENQIGEQYYVTLMDSRSRSGKEQGQTLEEIFQRYGVETAAASGVQDDKQIPNLRDMIHIDMDVDHATRRGEDGRARKGAPQLYFFDDLPEAGLAEFEMAQEHPDKPGCFAKKTIKHFIDVCKYYASDRPAYMGDLRHMQEQIYVLNPLKR